MTLSQLHTQAKAIFLALQTPGLSYGNGEGERDGTLELYAPGGTLVATIDFEAGRPVALELVHGEHSEVIPT